MSAMCDPGVVMIVDDDPSIRMVFSAVVKSQMADITIETAANGVEAVECFARTRPRVIVMDLNMPLMNGLQAHRAIDNMCAESNWDTPSILFCTGFSVPAAVDEVVKDSPRHQLIYKPVTPDSLVASIRQHLQAE